jgi:DNA-binding NarL/FixJ family response regulator
VLPACQYARRMASWPALRAALHDLELDQRAWVEAIHAECRAQFDEGLGTFVYAYRFGQRPTIRLTQLAGSESAPAFWRALEAWGASNAGALARSYRTGPGSIGHAERSAVRMGSALSNARAAFEVHGVADVFTLVGHDPSGFGLFVTAARSRAVAEPGRAQRRALELLATELAVAARLRERRRRADEARLSASEQQVVRLLMAGAADKCIAAELGVSLSTVSTLLQRVRIGLGCRPGEELLLLRPAGSKNLGRRLELFGRLTSSECEVAGELLVGSTHADIAQRRGVSKETIASQCAAVYRKCGVSGRRELAAALL